jgi:type II secretory pathway pseudopilin PulG
MAQHSIFNHTPARHARGFTVIETLVVITISTTAIVALSTIIVSFYRNNAYLLESTQALNSAHQGITEVVRAARQASYGDDGSYPVASAGTSTLTLYSNADNDTFVEKITYSLINGVLYRATVNSAGVPPVYTGQPISTTTVATFVTNSSSTPLFTYFDSSGNQLSSTSTPLASIASIQVLMLVDINPYRAPNVFTLSESATLRNLRVK